MLTRSISTLALAAAMFGSPAFAADLPSKGEVGPNVPALRVRGGYRVTVAAENFGEARFMEMDDNGTLYISQPGRGNITALTDPDANGVYQNKTVFVTGHKSVHGLHYFGGWLWFTESGAIYKTRPMQNRQPAGDIITVIPNGQLPSGGHWWRPIFVTDTGFFTAIGDPGNINDVDRGKTLELLNTANAEAAKIGLVPQDMTPSFDGTGEADREKIWFYSLDGKKRVLFCSGIRNTEKLRYRPGTQDLFGCDHGSDNFGGYLGEKKGNQPVTDNNPPCEFNRYIQGGFYGHPFISGNILVRHEFENRKEILDLASKTTPPEWCVGPHWATNGWCFLSKDYFPGHKGDALVACHGSWNSTEKHGYCIARVMFDPETNHPYGMQVIVSALKPETNGNTLRPVDCLETPDGSVLFTSDSPPRLFRITRVAGVAKE